MFRKKLNISRIILLLISASAILSSCKKDKLQGDAEILVGKWNWVYTQRITNTCNSGASWVYSNFDSSSSNNNYTIEFFSKGKVEFYHNKSFLWRHRIVFEMKETIVDGPYTLRFRIRLDNREGNILEGYVGQDSLRLPDFPYDTDNSCELRYNHFIRD